MRMAMYLNVTTNVTTVIWEPAASNDGIGDGTMTIDFADCSTATVTYAIDGLGLSGEIPIQRIELDNVALCEIISTQ